MIFNVGHFNSATGAKPIAMAIAEVAQHDIGTAGTRIIIHDFFYLILVNKKYFKYILFRISISLL